MLGACLRLGERVEVALGVASGRSPSGVARGLGRAVSTVAREAVRNGGRGRYPAVVAARGANRQACRPKRHRLAVDPGLAREWANLPTALVPSD